MVIKAYDRARPLISIHIPKCGGVSFLQVLSGWFGLDLYTHYYDRDKDQPPPRHQLKGGICIHGHFNSSRGFGVRDYYPEVDQFITVLRDPFEQALSHYFYVKKNPEIAAVHDQDWVKNPDYTLEKFLSSRRTYVLTHLPFEITEENIEDVLSSNFVHMGIMEDLQGSVDSLADKLSVPRTKVEHLNMTERPEEAPPAMRDIYIENHPLEHAAYEFARAHYND